MPPPTHPIKVAIIGAPTSSGNRGVLALASALVNLLANGRPHVQVTLLVGSPSPVPLRTVIDGRRVEIPAINYRLNFKSGLSQCLPWIFLMSFLYRILPIQAWRRYLRKKIRWIDCLASCDLVGDVRGGDSFSDIYGMQRFCWGFLCAATALLVNGKLIQFPQTYGPFKSPIARAMARFLLKKSHTVIARDTRSQKVAQDLLENSKEVHLSPDVAFALEVLHPNFIGAATTPAIGINVNGLMYNGGYDRNNMFGLSLDYPAFLQGLIKRLIDEGKETIWLVPHTYAPIGDVESDNEACVKVKESLPEKYQGQIVVVSEEFDQHEIKGVISKCDAFIGSRMHSCIAALSQGIPCVGLAYSMKFSGVFESVGMGDWVVEAKQETTEDAINRSVDLLLHQRAKRAEDLSKKSDSARSKLNQLFSQLVDTNAKRI